MAAHDQDAGHRDGSRSGFLTWTSEAEARLCLVPEGAMRDLTRQRVEHLARRKGQDVVTVELMEAKYHQWAEGSVRVTGEMDWTEEAKQRVERVPTFVRGMVVKAVEAYATSQGLAEITPGTVEEAKTFWGETGRFHQP
ncbi:MAG: PCP reductase family protein [Chloroflexi bacterium]|nr:PCP reductase family protein [Chloroflexota bacterium]